jgi:quinoprotein glucose dehydrogenase
MRRHIILLMLLALAAAGNSEGAMGDRGAADDWPCYNGDPGGTHYSRLTDINVGNVAQLKLAWTYDAGESLGEGWLASDMQSNPLVISGKLYFVSPKGRLISLNAATGKELWAFDPAGGKPVNTRQRLRGASWWSDGKLRRVLFTFRARLYAVDADTGRPAQGFGENGSIDMRDGIGRDPSTVSVSNVTPGAVWRDLIIMGSTGNTPGHVRAYNVRTGKLAWVFHTIPWPGEVGYETWPKDAWKSAMGANDWAGMSLDEKRGLVLLPLASAGMANKDFYGADRHGDNLFADSLVALDANTGKRIWHFQTVRHDLWDRDLPAPPTLVTVTRDGKKIDAAAQITKSGFVYLFDRATGEPLFPFEERSALASDIPGEQIAPSQIFPTLPAPFARQQFTAEMLTQRTPEAHAATAKIFASLRSRGPFDPPSAQGTIIFPGLDGGGEWGGPAYDPDTGLLYINANEMAWILKLKKHPAAAGNSGRAIFLNNCAVCHGEDRRGSPPEFPSLVGVSERLPMMDMFITIMGGSGRMPAFGQLALDQVEAVVDYLRTGEDREVAGGKAAAPLVPGDSYVFDGYTKFLDPEGYPAVAPPWGTLSALDVNSGKYAWKIPFGEYPELAAKGLTNTGSENYGGAVVTAGGLLFIGATSFDRKFHAYDKRTGELLWEATLPAGGNATPATYRVGGRQFVAIGAGGGKDMKSRAGSTIVAFALPE